MSSTPAPLDPSGRPWASLPEDLIRLVASRLLAGDLLDYVRFRAVCASWLSATASPRGRAVGDPRFHPRRWIMFPEGHGLYPRHPDLRGHIRFVNLDTGALARAHLPLFAEHVAMDSVDGLLVLFRERDTAVRLLHPFTGDIVEFPPLATLVPQIAERQQWNLSSWRYESVSSPPFSFRGKLYVAHPVLFCDHIHIHQIDPPVKDCEPQPPKLIATLPKGNLVNPVHMVECDSEILVLGYKDPTLSQIVVFKLADLARQRCVQITSIGGNTLFISESSLSVSSNALRTAMGDAVLTTDSGQQHLVQYHLITGNWSPAADDCRVYGPAPGPCTFMHHILSCCIRSRWYVRLCLPTFTLCFHDIRSLWVKLIRFALFCTFRNTGRIFGRNPKGWYGGR
ncbi:hypothetical protein HU200_032804 [Digitaria exilis]|uniref:F-box domain-containing protein n=1 Tax=Digitaria exilis TaxID=1010633 RepID=A0A835BSQ3_9POAL|nr:hypothetical protein HU200_032804 [Digitaria exilis]